LSGQHIRAEGDGSRNNGGSGPAEGDILDYQPLQQNQVSFGGFE
jgi:hypothetical protein